MVLKLNVGATVLMLALQLLVRFELIDLHTSIHMG